MKAARDGSAQLVAMAEGYGPAFLEPAGGDAAPVLRLARDDVPIRGRVIDIQGRPVAGATIQLVGILRPNSGTLDEWLDALKKERAAYPVQSRTLRSWSGDDIPALFPAVVADREGRFTLKGVGRERIAALLVGGPGIETRFEYAATRDMPAVKVPLAKGAYNPIRDVVFHGAAPELAAGPGLEIVGTVRDKDSGRPLAGITVQTTFGLRQSVPLPQDDHRRTGRLPALGVTPEGRLRRGPGAPGHARRRGRPTSGRSSTSATYPGRPRSARTSPCGAAPGRAGGSSIARPAGRSLRNSITSCSRTIRT